MQGTTNQRVLPFHQPSSWAGGGGEKNEGEKVHFEGTSRTWQSSKAVDIANIEYALLRNQASLLEAVLLSAGVLRGSSLDMFITC